jgi:hypothetical protein
MFPLTIDKTIGLLLASTLSNAASFRSFLFANFWYLSLTSIITLLLKYYMIIIVTDFLHSN